MSFAEPLRAMIRTMMIEAGIHPDRAERYLSIAKEVPIPELKDRSARYLLRTLGTEWGRDLIDVGIWVGIAMGKVERAHGLVVIDDMRFPQEREAIIKAQGEVWRIERPGHSARPGPEHRSDGAMEGDTWGWDEVIVNDRTMADLGKRLSLCDNRAI